MAKRVLLLIFATLAFGVALGYFFGYDQGGQAMKLQSISSFEECADAGYPIMESYPEQCATPDGKHFTRQIDTEEEATNDNPEEFVVPPGKPEGATDPIRCPMDVKLCADGSAVGRTGPGCTFPECPGE